MKAFVLKFYKSVKERLINTRTHLLVWANKSTLNKVIIFLPALVLIVVSILGFLSIYMNSRKQIAADNIEGIAQTASVRVSSKDGQDKGTVDFADPDTGITLSPEDKLNWRKQVLVDPISATSDTTIYEKIDKNETFTKDSLKIPPGWKVQWTTDNTENPKDANFTDAEPNSGVTYIKLTTNTVTTTQPTSQSALIKPLDQEPIATKDGLKVVAAKEYNDKIYVFYKSVNVIGVNNDNELTIGCLDLSNYETCKLNNGSSFPTYLSSENVPLGQGAKDINTPPTMQYGFKDGKLYMPAQKGNEFGVNCVDLENQTNCGFYSRGTTAIPSNQQSGRNPVMITGFAQSGDKLYGHANFNNGNSNTRDDYVQIVCFDMNNLSNQGLCDGFTSGENSRIPSLYTPEHNNEFSTPGQNLIKDNKYYFLMNYNQDNLRKVLGSYYSQTLFGDRLICYDLTKSNTPTDSTCAGWPSGSFQVDATNIFNILTQTAYGASIYNENEGNNLASPRDGYPTPTQLFFNKNQQGGVLSACVIAGQFTNGTPTINGDPGIKCFSESNGQSGTGTPKPSGILPTQWLNVPWQPSNAVFQLQNDTQDRIFLSYRLGAGALASGGNFFNVQNQKTAVICYDWKTSSPCKDNTQLPNNTVQVQGFRFPNYWYGIDGGNAGDSAYINDDKCILGVSENNFIWSFDSITGESPCRQTSNNIEIKPQVDLTNSFCDGEPIKNRNIKYASLKFDDLSLYDFKKINVTIKDKNGTVIEKFKDYNIKDNNGSISLASIDYSGNTDELKIEVNGELLNTSPWANDNLPKATIVFDGPPAQYCYQTEVKDFCNISKVDSESGIEAIGLNNSRTKEELLKLDVEQTPERQCFKNLQLSINSPTQVVSPGQEIVYNINLNNTANINSQGLGVVSDARIEATIPANTSLVTASEGYTIESNKVIWRNQVIDPQANLEKTITLKLNNQLAKTNQPSIIPIAQAATSSANFSVAVFYSNDTSATSSGFTDSSVTILTPDPPPPDPPPTDPPPPDPLPSNPDTTDTTPPSQPQNLSASNIKFNSLDLNWSQSTDESSSFYYQIFRNNALLASTFSNSYTDSSVEANTEYEYYIRAVDAAGNISQNSNVVSVKTLESITIAPSGRQAPGILRDVESIINIVIGAQTQPQVSNNPIIATVEYFSGVARSVPRPIALATPYLFIGLLFVLAVVYALQSLREFRINKGLKEASNNFTMLKEASRNFAVLSSHYVNTPISIMQLSAELMASKKIISHKDYENVSSLLKETAQNTKKTLESKYFKTENISNVANPDLLIRGGELNRFYVLMWLPVFISLSLVILINVVIWRADLISISSISTGTQILLFVLAAFLLLLSWRGLRRNKDLRKVRENQLKAEKELFKAKLGFIDETLATLSKNSADLNKFVKEVRSSEQSQQFIAGYNDLKSLEGLFYKLKQFSQKPPFGRTSSVKIDEIVENSLNSNSKEINSKNLTITKALHPGTVKLSPDAVEQLLNSVISNAVKFSNKEGRILISTVQKDSKIELVIRDSGAGIDKSKIQSLLEPFSRATDPLKYDYDGLGLGLYIDRIIVQQVGGSISIESQKNQGTEVRFVLPMDETGG